MADEIMASYAEDLASITLVPGHKGVHKVFINDELVFDKAVAGRFPDPAEIFEKMIEKLE